MIKKSIATLLLIAGFCISGSDGYLFPWINFAGMTLPFLAGWILLKGMTNDRPTI